MVRLRRRRHRKPKRGRVDACRGMRPALGLLAATHTTAGRIAGLLPAPSARGTIIPAFPRHVHSVDDRSPATALLSSVGGHGRIRHHARPIHHRPRSRGALLRRHAAPGAPSFARHNPGRQATRECRPARHRRVDPPWKSASSHRPATVVHSRLEAENRDARWTIFPRATRDSILIDDNTFGEPDDLKTGIAPVWSCAARSETRSRCDRSSSGKPSPQISQAATYYEEFVRNTATTYWHQTGTAKMGRDPMSVVDAAVKVYRIANLRVADGSIVPRITTGNTMAPCVVIGERAAEVIISDHQL